MTRQLILQELRSGLWHTTHPDRFADILKAGGLLPEPDISDGSRWKTSRGREFYPYVRTIGAVSLFDFKNFDPEEYSAEYPMSSWVEFVPFRKVWGCAVWIEVDRAKIARKFISASDLVAKWKSDQAYKHTIMPYIEAAHIGFLPKGAFRRVFLVRKNDDCFYPQTY